jgi:hypothetical protein
MHWSRCVVDRRRALRESAWRSQPAGDLLWVKNHAIDASIPKEASQLSPPPYRKPRLPLDGGSDPAVRPPSVNKPIWRGTTRRRLTQPCDAGPGDAACPQGLPVAAFPVVPGYGGQLFARTPSSAAAGILSLPCHSAPEGAALEGEGEGLRLAFEVVGIELLDGETCLFDRSSMDTSGPRALSRRCGPTSPQRTGWSAAGIATT